ncbi:MAG: PKD domain-containing protein [Candidatus Pseudobacter hemicellulosilyticus]|uniref:PKD domain-containing protein n=1 Tax=Candidatus Pseudobacter hemicellulosilyticus TaxID=3121375 RepID=A0AAJ5WRF4_9BACT|nr:MAG: PKD domain-containing protein [Pseudobacter sp.]
MKRNLYILCPLLCLALMTGSCKKDGGSGVKAVFSYVADGYKVNFTNFSTNAQTYLWDFGDGTSTAKSPQHIYTAKGDFLVKLTVTNGEESSFFADTVKVTGPNIKIDTDLSDWLYVGYSYENAESHAGTIRAVKAFAGPDDIFFYMEGTGDMKIDLFDMYIDADNNPATGFNTWMYPAGSGADFLLEGSSATATGGSVYLHQGNPADFSFTPTVSFADGMRFGPLTTVSGRKVMEFSIKKSALNSPKNRAVNFAFIELSTGWAQLGIIPESATPESKFITVPL